MIFKCSPTTAYHSTLRNNSGSTLKKFQCGQGTSQHLLEGQKFDLFPLSIGNKDWPIKRVRRDYLIYTRSFTKGFWSFFIEKRTRSLKAWISRHVCGCMCMCTYMYMGWQVVL